MGPHSSNELLIGTVFEAVIRCLHAITKKLHFDILTDHLRYLSCLNLSRLNVLGKKEM